MRPALSPRRIFVPRKSQRPTPPLRFIRGIWQTWTWGDVAERVRALACGLSSLGFKRGDNLAIIGDKTDNIQGIYGWGPKRVKKLFEAVAEDATGSLISGGISLNYVTNDATDRRAVFAAFTGCQAHQGHQPGDQVLDDLLTQRGLKPRVQGR